MPLISFELKGLDLLSQQLQKSLTAALAVGVQQQTEAVRQAWLQKVEAEGQRRLKVYAEAVENSTVEHSVGGDPLHGQIVIRDNPRVRRLEEGGPKWDMKPGLLAGPKSRPMKGKAGKKGGRYNIIPIGFSTESGFDAWQFHGVSPFRIVSSRSPANSWIYPAQEGVHLIPEVVQEMTPKVSRALSKVVREWRR